MSDPQLADVARVCNRYPDIEVEFDVVGGETVSAGEPVQLTVRMDRSLPEGQELAPVHAPRSASLSVCASDTLRPRLHAISNTPVRQTSALQERPDSRVT